MTHRGQEQVTAPKKSHIGRAAPRKNTGIHLARGHAAKRNFLCRKKIYAEQKLAREVPVKSLSL
jgi:hypothetical protein